MIFKKSPKFPILRKTTRNGAIFPNPSGTGPFPKMAKKIAGLTSERQLKEYNSRSNVMVNDENTLLGHWSLVALVHSVGLTRALQSRKRENCTLSSLNEIMDYSNTSLQTIPSFAFGGILPFWLGNFKNSLYIFKQYRP